VSDFSPSGVAPTKPAMRAAILAARMALPVPERRRRDTAIAAALASLARGVVAAFVPLAHEPGDLEALVDARSVLLPVLRDDNDLDWAVFDGSLAPGRFGLREPTGVRLGVDAVLGADLLVVPALAVDGRGGRLGRGGGSYDRVLARVAGAVPALAVVDDEEVVPAVPMEPHDRPVQGYVTPGGVHRVVR
jgi:5-formyltetrahydrofolate cyclo-ligase